MSIPTYFQPRSLEEALRALANSRRVILAGGTDYYAGKVGQEITEAILDITAVEGLRALCEEHDHWRIGAAVTWTDIVRAILPAQFRGLQAAAREIGGVQVQNSGTVVGNVCNASPAADGVPVLMSLGARVEISSVADKRVVPIEAFVIGNRKVALQSDELVTAVLIPKRHHARSSFLKLGNRRYLVISIAMVAVLIETDAANIVTHAGVAVGSCSVVAKRLSLLERKLVGQAATRGLSALVEAVDLDALAPIDDVRGTAAYRRDAAHTLVKRAIEEALHE